MTQRLNYQTASPEAFKALLHVEQVIRRLGLDENLLELLKTRASQLNGCAWCLDMHTKDALARGETAQRLFLLSGWRDTPCYSDKERAMLAWVEAVTTLQGQSVPDDVYNDARKHFDEKQLVDLTLAIIAINGWNRLNVAFRTTVGDYVSPHGKAA